jgi:hypothetical protein
MITAIVRFKLPASIDAAKAEELFKSSAPKMHIRIVWRSCQAW